MQKHGVIYRVYHKGTGMSYVGQTVNFKVRSRKHLAGYGGNVRLERAIKKHGEDAFGIEILESDVPVDLLDKMEILSIRFWGCVSPNGYNLNGGGGGRGTVSEEYREKMSNMYIGDKNPMYGKTHKGPSLEVRQRMSKKERGKWTSEMRERWSQQSKKHSAADCRNRAHKKSSPLQLRLFD